jgi:hypothetical protein
MMMLGNRDYARTWDQWHDEACPVCGLDYVRGSEEDRRIHRARHREVPAVYEPKPNQQLVALYSEHGPFVPVHRHSPPWMRNRLGRIARMFSRELGFGVPYSAGEDAYTSRQYPYQPLPYHWMIVDTDGRSIGGLSARWRQYQDAPARWVWASPTPPPSSSRARRCAGRHP